LLKQHDRKCCILFKELPGDEHMCLIIYPEVLPAPWHDAIMKVLESEVGQQASDFADALHRSLLPDGRPILQTLHEERMMKKVRTADVVVTPRQGATIRLDELNKILGEMRQGESAIMKLSENDAARGLVSPEVKRLAEENFKNRNQPAQKSSVPPMMAPTTGALTDRDLAANMLAQAIKMDTDARELINEAARLKKEAEKLDPRVTPAVLPPPPPPKKRGRPTKEDSAVADAVMQAASNNVAQ
jgi:hypothetical protein